MSTGGVGVNIEIGPAELTAILNFVAKLVRESRAISWRDLECFAKASPELKGAMTAEQYQRLLNQVLSSLAPE